MKTKSECAKCGNPIGDRPYYGMYCDVCSDEEYQQDNMHDSLSSIQREFEKGNMSEEEYSKQIDEIYKIYEGDKSWELYLY